MKCLVLTLIFTTQFLHAQHNSLNIIDSLYREDQFYFKFTYHTFIGKTEDLTSNSIALGFNLGFLRDFPINKKRTWAVAPGFGIGSSFGNNIKAFESFIIDDEPQDFNNIQFSYFNFELPLEIRWRDSTPEKIDFLRVYSGFKLSYLYFFGLENIEKNNLNILQYGPYISIGYSNWNFYFYYSLNPMFSNNYLAYNSEIGIINYDLKNIKNIQVGFIFYLL